MSGWQPGRQQPPAAAVLGAGLATVVTACWAGALRAPARPAHPILEPPGHLPGDTYAAPCFSFWCGSHFSSLVILWFTTCPLWARMLRSEGTQRRRTSPALRERPVPLSVPTAALGRGGGRAPQTPIRPGQSGKTAWRKWPALLRQPESSWAWEGMGAPGQGCCPGVLYVRAGVVAFPEGCYASCVPSRGVQTCPSVFQGPKVAPWRG